MGTVGTITPANVNDNMLLPQVTTVAKNLVSAKQRKLKNVPTVAQLADAINDVQLNGSMKNVSNIVVTIVDPQWKFLRSGFLDTDENSQIDPIDLNFPTGSRFWWRLTIVSPSGNSNTIALTFLVRECVYLQNPDLVGPKKANRAKMTRAEFLKSCVADCTEGEIEFYCQELDKKEPVAKQPKSTTAASHQTAGKGTKSPGVGANSKHLTVNGRPITQEQLAVANIALAACRTHNAPGIVAQAMIYAGMGENDLSSTDTWQNSTSQSTATEADEWLTGSSGFTGGGGIAVHRNNPSYSAWQIANATESNADWIGPPYSTYTPHTQDSYSLNAFNPSKGGVGQAAALAEAAAIVAAGGGSVAGTGSSGSSTTTTTTIEKYNYVIKPKELYWTGMLRLAQEVNWELFWDGNRLYYDSEQTLIQQKVTAVINLDDDVVQDFSYDWDTRQICTQMTLVLFDRPFQFRPGEVFQVTGFGPASTGSSAKPTPLPGCWLIQDLQRNGADEYTTYTLVQPDLPKLEPAPQIKTTTKTVSGTGGQTLPGIAKGSSGQAIVPRTPEAAFTAATYLSGLKLIYTQQVRTMMRDIAKLAGQPAYDCSASVSWVLLGSGFPLPGGITWGGWAPTSGAYVPGAAGLVSGPGQYMTIYASPNHVFIRIHPQGYVHDMQGNTVNPGGSGFGFFSWTEAGASPDGGPNPGPGGAGPYGLVHYPGT